MNSFRVISWLRALNANRFFSKKSTVKTCKQMKIVRMPNDISSPCICIKRPKKNSLDVFAQNGPAIRYMYRMHCIKLKR